LPLKLP